MSVIFVIYHFEKIVIPLEKKIDFEMTLEIIIIIISKRKTYQILAEGQHNGTSPAYTWSMLQASLLQERNTIYRYNGSVHRWIVVRQGFSLPIKSRNFGAWFEYWKIYPSKYFFSRVFHDSNDEITCHRSGVLPQIFVNTLNLNLLLNLQHFGSSASRTFSGTLHHLSTNLCRRYPYFPC